MAKSGFNLGDYLKTAPVSKADTAQEQIEYIPLDDIEPDPENFYSLEGLDELAGNIELVGLQQPIRVRPTPSVGSADSSPKGGAKGDRYTVVSGHRRRAACLLIRDGGSEQFSRGVPCIVERGDVSREMQELRLIYANSSTRVMTSAELSKQAERVEELLYTLKGQGVEFPGRMRDHVAQAVNASKTKLARLHAIRANLNPSLLAEYDAGRINESVAYRISQEDSAVQAELAKAPAIVRGETAEKIGQIIDRLKAPQKPVGAIHESPADKRAEEDEKYFEMLSEVADRFLPCIAGVPSRREGIEALKREHGFCHHGGDGENCVFNSWPNGLALDPLSGPEITRSWTEVYDLLCTIAVARLLAKDLDAPAFRTGDPPRAGRYFARIDMGDGGTHEAVGEYRGGSWSVFNGPLYETMKVTGWWPLPDKEA
jgi:ParB-like chromosome segregation protein Spo0J